MKDPSKTPPGALVIYWNVLSSEFSPPFIIKMASLSLAKLKISFTAII